MATADPRSISAFIVMLFLAGILPGATAGVPEIPSIDASVATGPSQDRPACGPDAATQALLTSGALAFTETPDAGTWPTWWLGPDAITVPPPPDTASQTTVDELAELHGYQDNRSQFQTFKAVLVDGDGVPGTFWSSKTLNVISIFGLRDTTNPARMGLMMGLLETAYHDAMVISWHYKYCYQRPAPYHIDPTLRTLAKERPVPSYPSEHAAVAGAAAFILDQFFPGKKTADGTTAEVLALALESRLVAGANYRSDVEAGVAIGEAVARHVLERYEDDVLHQHWNGRGRPDPNTVPCAWKETPPTWHSPIEPLFGQVSPILLASGDQFRAPPPPACDGDLWLAQSRDLYEASQDLTDAHRAVADDWDLGRSTELPPGRGIAMALDATQDHDLPAMHHQRVLSHVAAAQADSGIACWDTKYTYWTERPYTTVHRHGWNDTWLPYVETPATPGYVSEHACFIAAATDTLGWFFPEDAAGLRALQSEVDRARFHGGVQLRGDNDRGLTLGSQVAGVYIAHAEDDGIGPYY